MDAEGGRHADPGRLERRRESAPRGCRRERRQCLVCRCNGGSGRCGWRAARGSAELERHARSGRTRRAGNSSDPAECDRRASDAGRAAHAIQYLNAAGRAAAMRAAAAARGFTLIELMVAVFITAMLLSMGYGAVNQALTNHDALTARQERLLAVQTTMRLFTQDFTQLTPRPVRQPLGDGWLPALAGAPGTTATTGSSTTGANAIVTLTRAGWANPAGIQRSALQRVTYILEKGSLRREHWPVLDATMTT